MKMVYKNYFQDLLHSLPQDTALSLPVCKENFLEIQFDKENVIETVFKGSEPPLPYANSDVFSANILLWRRLTAVNESCKAVYEVTFDVQNSSYTFKAGDTIGIIPKNDKADVSAILTHLDLTSVADSSYTISSHTALKISKIPGHIPVKSSLRYLLTHCVDLRSVLKKLFLLELSRHTKDEKERRILEYFCSKEGSNAYQTHILDRNICLLDIFAIFKTCKPPIQVLLPYLPRLLPRPYSIVNSGLKDHKIIKICFSVMPLQNNRRGLTTSWLERLILSQEDLERRMDSLIISNEYDKENYKVPIYLRKNLSGFCLPESMETPLILIGPGTGVSPFIGFLEERELFKETCPEIKHGEVWLFFGCRNPKLDFIYEKELNAFLSRNVLTEFCAAFSRVETSEAKYIQDNLLQKSNEIAKLIESNASIFVCGDLKSLALQIKDTIIQCLVASGKTLEEANKLMILLQKDKKYVVDAWS